MFELYEEHGTRWSYIQKHISRYPFHHAEASATSRTNFTKRCETTSGLSAPSSAPGRRPSTRKSSVYRRPSCRNSTPAKTAVRMCPSRVRLSARRNQKDDQAHGLPHRQEEALSKNSIKIIIISQVHYAHQQEGVQEPRGHTLRG